MNPSNDPTTNPQIRSQSTLLALLAILLIQWNSNPTSAQESQWNHQSSIYLITTPDGANLPEASSEENFPVLVRLHKDFFDFNTADPNGNDIRFVSDGLNLPYQIEQWDASIGNASIWVQVPKIHGNQQQEIKIHWGNTNAKSESNGAAVFNSSNHYLSVLHLDASHTDQVGLLSIKDNKTTESEGRIGPARHLENGQGISAGEQIEGLPIGSSSHSTEAWIRPNKPNGRVLGWGNEHAQGKVIMHFKSPPHVEMEC
ncbi:MAG: DUF2341 domain-containing protein, partial [Planctomycetota bacterium]